MSIVVIARAVRAMECVNRSLQSYFLNNKFQ